MKLYSVIATMTCLLAVLLASGSASAQTATCNALSSEQKALAKKIMDSQYLYACCDETISACLAAKNKCALATRIADAICFRVSKGEDEKRIVKRLNGRARSMNPHAKSVSIDYDNAAVAGSESAPVRVTVYACASCPFCGKLIPKLHREVVSGRLKGKVRLYFKVFPLRNHDNAAESGLALTAARRLNSFWPYLTTIYSNFKDFSKEKAVEWAVKDGMDADAFKRLMSDAKTRKSLVESRKEGLVNQVDATPSLFINERRYRGFLDLEEVVDILEEEYERVK